MSEEQGNKKKERKKVQNLGEEHKKMVKDAMSHTVKNMKTPISHEVVCGLLFVIMSQSGALREGKQGPAYRLAAGNYPEATTFYTEYCQSFQKKYDKIREYVEDPQEDAEDKLSPALKSLMELLGIQVVDLRK